MFNTATISLLAGILSIFAISIAFNIFNKVYQENYKKPWLFIAFSAILWGLAYLLKFLIGFSLLRIYSPFVDELIIEVLSFMGLIIFTYALLLEYLILQYYKGKFVKMKLLPVQEGNMGGELDLDVSQGNSYLIVKKDRNFLLEQFVAAISSGFEGFLITTDSPKQIRVKYKIQKTPIAWIIAVDEKARNSSYIKSSLDEASEIVEPLQINNLISFIDNFLEQSTSPFILIEMGEIFRNNNHPIIMEFLKYVSGRIAKYNGIMIATVNTDVLEDGEITELGQILRRLD